MRSLFAKVFLWTLGVLIVTVFLSTLSEIASPGVTSDRMRDLHSRLLPVHGMAATEIYERDGRAAVASYLRHVAQDLGVHAVLLDREARPLSPCPDPQNTAQFARKALAQNRLYCPYPFQTAAYPVSGRSGASYALVGSLRAETPSESRAGLRRLAVVCGGLLLVSYPFARQIVRPILQLRSAAQRLASGDLSARVGGHLGRRKDEIGQLGRDFDAMAERLQGLVNAQRRLIADVSHELRSPLARLQVAVALGRRRGIPEMEGLLARIEEEGHRLNALIEQLLLLSRLESGSAPERSDVVDLASLAREVAADAAFEAEAASRIVEVVTSGPVILRGDAGLLRSTLENVVRNAVRYTAPGTCVTITVHREESSSAVVEVRDAGPGVPEQDLALLFRPFTRVAESRDRNSGGVGLGLAIAERAVHAHGGSILAENMPHGGLLVRIRLPLQ